MTRIPVGFQPLRSQNFSFLNPVHGLQKTDWWFVLIYDTAATSRATFLRGTCERYFWISRGNLDRICWKREFYVWFRNYETARTCASRNSVKNTFCRGAWYFYFLPPPSLSLFLYFSFARPLLTLKQATRFKGHHTGESKTWKSTWSCLLCATSAAKNTSVRSSDIQGRNYANRCSPLV